MPTLRPSSSSSDFSPEESLRREVERLRQQLTQRDQQLDTQQQQIDTHQQRIAELEQEREQLRREIAELRKDSRTSHRPPSTDAPAARACRPRARTRRRRPGGQPGHAGHGRRLAPPEQVAETRLVLPPACRHCHAHLPQDPAQVSTRGPVDRHQVTEIPPLCAFITEWRAPRVVCPGCGHTTQAELPQAVTASAFGPRLTALIASLTVAQRVSRRGLEEVLTDVLGCPIALGTVQARVEEASAALAGPVTALRQQLPQAAAIHADETGWATHGQRRWLWVFVAPLFVLYAVAASRAAHVLSGIFIMLPGIWTTG